ncbi:MAG TPA: PAS domain S-box protein [Oscillatoriaceae cyanobacterium M33_DOE_052]|uniref:Circadian input-output histidine kinase CikA n=1 Tax=Planktothricoides sp. SpSt-374 TaxID=2282167 RepID=A0A7C3VSF2_9CYAN|nr:PAS domain S-box protein [Oscillatoriaceae cyanobacterium M33_DOE_052]
MKARISQMATAFIISMAVVVLLGWQFDIQLLKTGLTGTPWTMKPNTAFCFLLCGISLALWQAQAMVPRGKALGQVLPGIVITIASLTLVQYIFGWDLGIDQLFYQNKTGPSTAIYPLRIPETTAINFILAGIALSLRQKHNHRHQHQVEILTVMVGSIGLLTLIGYLFGATFFYEFIIPTTITTPPTAITFIVLSIGILFTRTDTEMMQTLTSTLVGGVMARKLLPAAIFLPLILNWLIFEGYQMRWYDIPSSYAYITAMKIGIISTLIYWIARQLNQIEQRRQEVFQQFYRAVLDSPLPIIIHAEDGAVLQISNAWTEITGYQPEEISTIAAWTELAYGENHKNMQAMIKGVYGIEKSAKIGEFNVRICSGLMRVWDFYTAPLGRMPDGRRFVITTAIDITDKKQIETELKKVNKNLEARVKLRTAQLEEANDRLERQLLEKQISEQTARKSQALLNSIIECSTELIAAQDMEFKYIAFNRAYQQEFAQLFNRQVKIGTSMVEALAHLPTEQVQAVEIWGRAIGGEEFTIIREFGTTTNQPNWYEITFSAVRDAMGKQIGASQIVKNVTHRITDEMALRQSEARFQAFMNHSPALAWITRSDGKFMYCNRNFEQLLSKSAAELIGKMIWEIFPPDLSQQYLDNNQLVSDTGEVVETIETAYNSAGEVVDYLVFKFLIPDEIDQNLVGGVAIDITERKKAERALEESEAKLKAILDNAPAAIYLKDCEGRFLLLNRYCLDIFGFTPEQYHGQTIIDLLPGEMSSQVEANDREVWQSGQAQYLEEQLPQADGIHTYYSVKFLLYDLAGHPYALCGISTDITERKRAEELIIEAKEAAEQANQAKSSFLANMSHELRTPLNAILGFSQVLGRDSSLSEQQQEQIAIVNSSGEHLLSLINDILEISKIEAGRMALNPTNFDLLALIAAMEAIFQSRAAAKGLQMICEVDAKSPRYIRTDEGKLRQVLSNLLGNAIKFTTSGCVSLRVRADHPGDIPAEMQLSFEISDTGPGIAADELDKLFSPFVQTQTGRSIQEGTGLGLAISRKLVQLMGGDMAITSTVGEGTLVKFYIPATVAAADEVKISLAMPRVIALEPGQPVYRILAVDDRLESRILLRQLLEPLGFEVREAQNGQEAIEQWHEWHPHLIWMDMRMPIIDGYEATRQIKNHLHGQATVIIALTASAFEENRSIILSAGCDDFVRKPAREEVLLAKIAEHLGVRYIYEPIATSESEDSFTGGTEQLPRGSPETALLEMMPPEWTAALHQAATAANSRVILQLLGEIPAGERPLSHNLRKWVDNFRFDKIIALIEARVHESRE